MSDSVRKHEQQLPTFRRGQHAIYKALDGRRYPVQIIGRGYEQGKLVYDCFVPILGDNRWGYANQFTAA